MLNGKWFVLGRELPLEMTVRDVFLDSALNYNIYASYAHNDRRVGINLERYTLYEKYKDHCNLLCKKFFIETTDNIVSPGVLRAKLEELKTHLFNALVLDRQTGITEHEREHLVAVKETEVTHVTERFQEMYLLSLRTRWCYSRSKNCIIRP